MAEPLMAVSARERAVMAALWNTGEFQETPDDFEWVNNDACRAVAGWDDNGEQGVIDAFLDTGALTDAVDPLPPPGAGERLLLDAALAVLGSSDPGENE